MNRLAVVAILIGLSPSSLPRTYGQTGLQPYKEPEAQINWSTEADGNRYVASLRISTLNRTPNWDAEAENPPLSARKARALALKTFEELAPYGEDVEYRASLRLRDDGSGKWFWVVYFTPLDWRGYQSTFPIPVLFDGSVVRPEIVLGASAR